MAISERQREDRRGSIGSSDSPAIVGCDPCRSAYDVYVEKTLETDEIEGNEPIEIGNDYERPLLAWAARELDVEIVLDAHGKSGIFHANHDALVVDRPWGIEAKTGSSKEYGDPGTDQVPDRVIVQTHHQMMVDDLEVVYVPLLTAVRDRLRRLLFAVRRDEDLIEAIKRAGEEFWKSHVLARLPPEKSDPPNPDLIARIRRQKGKVTVVDPGLVAKYLVAKNNRMEMEKLEEHARSRLLVAMGDAEVAEFGSNQKRVTFFEQSRVGVQSKALKLKHPAIYSQFSCETRYRVLRLAKK